MPCPLFSRTYNPYIMKPAKVSQCAGVKILQCQGVACGKVPDGIFLILWVLFLSRRKVQVK